MLGEFELAPSDCKYQTDSITVHNYAVRICPVSQISTIIYNKFWKCTLLFTLKIMISYEYYKTQAVWHYRCWVSNMIVEQRIYIFPVKYYR